MIYNTQIASPADFYRTLRIQFHGLVIISQRFSYHIEACTHNSTHVCGYNVWCEPRSLTKRVLPTISSIVAAKFISVLR